ncbi:hypothetical protein NPIL_450951 [Nephila pilipes]|uniref:Uncharacterized protein n=1 Tax=Nephila pilipes TaxID=299642 RepID=A0A8X6TI51_NEPPI|nr:hypothetical protein NPIL_450951 [Nephila pilipes]
MRVENLIKGDNCLTIQEIVKEVRVSKNSPNQILYADLNLRVDAKTVPKVLSAEQKELHLEVAYNLLDCQSTDSLNNVMTEDKSWVYEYKPESKAMEVFLAPKVEKAQHVQSKI